MPSLLQCRRPGSTQLKPCHPLGMPGDEDELPGSAFGSTERGKARHFLLAIPTIFLGAALIALGNLVPVAGPLRLPLDTLALALLTGGLILQRSRPQGSERALTPRYLRRIARLGGVPELGAMIVVYGCLIVAMTLFTLSTVALFLTIGSTTT
jgi:hypothetical protein